MGREIGNDYGPYSFNYYSDRLRSREKCRSTERSGYNYNGERLANHGYSTRSSFKTNCNEKKRPHGGTSDEAEDEGSLDGKQFQNHIRRRNTPATNGTNKSASDGEQNFHHSSMYDSIKNGEGRLAKRRCIQKLNAANSDSTEEEPQQFEPTVRERRPRAVKRETKAQVNGDNDDSQETTETSTQPIRITRSHRRTHSPSGSSTEEECNETTNCKSPLGKRSTETIITTRTLRTRRQVRPFAMPIQTHQRSFIHRRRHRPAHNASDSDSSSTEERFQRKKAAKLDKIRDSFLPLNMTRSDLMKGTINERVKVGSSMADIQPMTIDKSITFESIGGLDNHIDSLKEMVLFPLLYPEIFDKFKVQVPRGVLFYGPPGTGKTLVARALANECSVNGKKIAFFMRKGADCMSKWVGESERQLRCLFDQAHTMRPSIIFFDEIDGIAPVRSTRQDQIHSSIVSTLLALMDGLDSRGEIIVIGATNRIEAIDPALRRPGRFDREFHFPLPNYVARKDIISIHTKNWDPQLDSELVETLAGQTVGYCGADLKALCSEAVLLALKRRYKQIYKCKSKLKIDIDSIAVTKSDFDLAISGKIVPAAQRSVTAFGKPLPVIIRPLLYNDLSKGLDGLKQIFPLLFRYTKECSSVDSSDTTSTCQVFDDQLLTNEEVGKLAKQGTYRSIRFPGIFRPRLLITGPKDLGQRYIAAALLHQTDSSNQFKLDATRSADDLISWFSEAIKKLPIPSIIYVPSIEDLEENMFNLLNSLLCELEPTIPLMVLATCQTSDAPSFFNELFDPSTSTSRILTLQPFTRTQIIQFFSPLIFQYTQKPIILERPEELEVLAEEETVVNRKLSERELAKLRKREAISLRQLRNFLRDVLGKVIRDRRFSDFVKPVDKEEVPDYDDVIKNPMNLETMMLKIDCNCYETAKHFLDDIDLITANALEYNPSSDMSSKIIRHKAHALRDFAFTLIENEMDSDFETMCQEMYMNRKERGEVTVGSLPQTARMAEQEETCHANDVNSHRANEHNDAPPNGHSNKGRKKGRSNKSKSADNSLNDALSGDHSSTIVNSDSSPDGPANLGDVSMSEETPVTEDVPPSPATIVDENPSPKPVDEELSAEDDTALAKPMNEQPSDLTVKIDQQALDRILQRIATETLGCSLENLENLYWKLFRTISKHLDSVDRSSLIVELDRDIDCFKSMISAVEDD